MLCAPWGEIAMRCRTFLVLITLWLLGGTSPALAASAHASLLPTGSLLSPAQSAAGALGHSAEPAAREDSPRTATSVIPASAGRPMKVPEPTYRWRGLTVPVGACGAIIGGRAMVLSCGDKRVVAYRRAMAERDWVTAGALAAAAILGGVLLALRRMRRIPRPGGEM